MSINYKNNDIENIMFYWLNAKNSTEPIERNLLSFKEINKIFAVISEFPVSINRYLYLIEEKEDKIIDYCVRSYLNYNNISIKGLTLTDEDATKFKNFIKMFFDIKYPVKDIKDINIYWIYPKLEYKMFLASCISNNLLEEYYISSEALNSLVEIISAFSWSEYKDGDKNPVLVDNIINLPTLIYANIKLYEKGYINIKEINNRVEISLDINGNKKKKPIFSKNKRILKERIVKTCNENYKTNFTLEDIKV